MSDPTTPTWAQSVWTFLETQSTALGALSSVGSLFALSATFIALIFTGVQLRRSAAATRASTVYAIQKDAREFMEKLDIGLWKRAHGSEGAFEDDEQKLIGRIVQFYSSIFYQFKLGILDTGTWRPFEAELEFMARCRKPREFWERKRLENQYDPEFQVMLDGIFDTAKIVEKTGD